MTDFSTTRNRMQSLRRWTIAGLTLATGLAVSAVAAQPAASSQPQLDAATLRALADQLEASVDPTEAFTPADLARMMAARGGGGGGGSAKSDFPKFSDISEGFTQVATTDEGSFYNLWVNSKTNQVLAELPRGYESKKQFIATTVGSGATYAGLQVSDLYCQWKRYDDRLALIEPNMAVRSSGDAESRGAVERIFTDRVVLDVPIVAMGPNGQPVIDLDDLLLGRATTFFGFEGAGLNTRLAKVVKAKAFPQNIEVAIEVPAMGGQLRTFHYSISEVPARSSYRPRKADARVGYFTTTYRDLGSYDDEQKWVRYINRWHLEKRDPKLKLSPPKEPIVFYVDHATPVRYRRWVRQGAEYWNEAFRAIGIDGAIEVRFQDAQTGAHMEKDPEDVRFNFIRWLSNDQGTAIGPSRVHPETGQILDADVVITDGFLRSYELYYNDVLPMVAMENFGPETLGWLERNPRWDPRVRMADPAERDDIIRQREANRARGVLRYGGHPAAMADPSVIGDEEFDGLAGRVSQMSGFCNMGSVKGMQLAMLRVHWEIAQAVIADVESGSLADMPQDIPPEVLEMIRKQLEENPELADQLPAEIRAKLGLDTKAEPKDDDAEKADEKKDEKKDDKKPAKPVVAEGDLLDGIPEEFVGVLLADLVAHEVGHTLGLRHNFRASSIFTMDQINSAEVKGKKTLTGSVMDYNPVNIRMASGEKQGDFGMTNIGPYDMWAIEYGYTFEKPEKVLERVAEPELTYATDEDTWGPDPLATRWDMGADPLEFSAELIRLAEWHRARILSDFVKEGQSWSRARRGYQLSLWSHTRALSVATRFIGGSYIFRDKKGDPNGRPPTVPVEADTQRQALEFAIKHAFFDDAFGLTPELARHLTNDRWWDDGGFAQIFEDPAWPVHDRIMGIQASVLTQIMNPTTLRRVYDNEFRSDADADVLTLAEVIDEVSSAIWKELGETPSARHTARDPMISSLRRSLQREHVERLIDLVFQSGDAGPAGMTIGSLSAHHLRMIKDDIAGMMDGRAASRLDPYSLAHLTEVKTRIEKALDAQYIYNAGSMGGGMIFNLFGQDADENR